MVTIETQALHKTFVIQNAFSDGGGFSYNYIFYHNVS